MLKKKSIFKNTRKTFKVNEKKLISKNINSKIKLQFLNLNYKIWLKNSKVTKTNKCKVWNYCIISGRGLNILKTFKISRLQFKKISSFRNLTGIQKSSW